MITSEGGQQRGHHRSGANDQLSESQESAPQYQHEQNLVHRDEEENQDLDQMNARAGEDEQHLQEEEDAEYDDEEQYREEREPHSDDQYERQQVEGATPDEDEGLVMSEPEQQDRQGGVDGFSDRMEKRRSRGGSHHRASNSLREDGSRQSEGRRHETRSSQVRASKDQSSLGTKPASASGARRHRYGQMQPADGLREAGFGQQQDYAGVLAENLPTRSDHDASRQQRQSYSMHATDPLIDRERYVDQVSKDSGSIHAAKTREYQRTMPTQSTGNDLEAVTYNSQLFGANTGLSKFSNNAPPGSRQSEVELQLREIELKVTQIEQRDEQHFAELKSRVIGQFSKLDDDQGKRELSEVDITKEIKSFEKQVGMRLAKTKHSRKDGSTRLLKEIDETSFQLTLELAKLKKNREEAEIRYSEELADMIEKVASQVDQERVARDDGHHKLVEKLTSETQRVQDMVSLERKVREETQSTLVRLIEEMDRNLTRDIQNEQDERSQIEENFMDLMEQTCSRIERNLN